MCNYKKSKCTQPLHVTHAGTTVALCLQHYREYNAAQKRKVISKQHVSVDKRVASNLLRVKAHATNWKQVYLIQDIAIRRIAIPLLAFRDRKGLKDYVILRDVIGDTRLSSIRLQGLPEVISFDDNAASTTRSQQNITNSGRIVGKVLDAFKNIFPGCSNVAVKLLVSSSGDEEQLTHTDFNYESINRRVRSYKDFHYSALVAIEEGSHLLVGKNREKVDIPMNGMIFWRGSCPHAGGGYSSVNRRIFISISSVYCPVDMSVYIVK